MKLTKRFTHRSNPTLIKTKITTEVDWNIGLSIHCGGIKLVNGIATFPDFRIPKGQLHGCKQIGKVEHICSHNITEKKKKKKKKKTFIVQLHNIRTFLANKKNMFNRQDAIFSSCF